MNTVNTATVKILIASDIHDDAMMVRDMLAGEFSQLFISSIPKQAVADFDRHQPDILIMAFNELEKAEQYYLGLYRLSKTVNQHLHRTIILCGKDEVTRVADLCMKDFFDDYILFWPMTYDANRLLMSIHNAIRDLATGTMRDPSTEDFAAQIQELAEMKKLRAPQDEQHVQDGGIPPFVGEHDSARQQEREARELKVKPALSAEPAGPPDSKKKRKTITILIVDDDVFQRNLINSLLRSENYHVLFAATGSEALSVLRTKRPDVILMDVMMPNIDGIETTRRLKAMPQFSNIPVIMVTGDSEGDVVIKSLKAGASNFVVKPFNSTTLIAKINFVLGTAVPQKK